MQNQIDFNPFCADRQTGKILKINIFESYYRQLYFKGFIDRQIEKILQINIFESYYRKLYFKAIIDRYI